MSYQASLKNFKTVNLSELRPYGFLNTIYTLLDKRNNAVNKKKGWKNVLTCPLCDSHEHILEFTKFNSDIVRCMNCDLRYARKIPVDTADVYSDNFYLPSSIDGYMKNADYRKERFGKERLQIIKDHIGDFHNKRILDIGCGTGWFLEIAIEFGLKGFGQDLGKELASWTSDRLNIPVFNVPISEIPVLEKFDVITMFDLIEHIPDPVDLILSCKHLLKKNGIILLFTPNFDSLAISVMGVESNLITIPEHVVYFTKKSIETLAVKTNLKLKHFCTAGIDMGDLKAFFEYKEKTELSNACVYFYDLMQPIIDQANAGNHIRFVLANKN